MCSANKDRVKGAGKTRSVGKKRYAKASRDREPDDFELLESQDTPALLSEKEPSSDHQDGSLAITSAQNELGVVRSVDERDHDVAPAACSEASASERTTQHKIKTLSAEVRAKFSLDD